MRETRITRRALLELGGAAGLGAALAGLPGCAGPVRSTPNPAFMKLPTAPADGEVVFGVFRSHDTRRVCDQVLPAVTDMKWLSRGDSVFVKVASNSPNAHPAVTSPSAVKAVVGYLRDHGAGPIYVGDQAGVEHVRLTRTGRQSSTRQAMARNGLAAAVRAAGAKLHCFDDHRWFGYFRPRGDFANHWEQRLYLPRILRAVDHVVNLPRLGTHGVAGYTCAVKNAVGWIRDDSRFVLHHRAGTFFEKVAEINHFSPLRDKVRFTLTLAERALTDIGPDFGGKYDFGGTLVLGARRLVDHDHLAAVLLPWLDRDSTSFFDLYNPYPEHADHWNRKLVKDTWGKQTLATYQPMVPYPLRGKLAHDVCLSHLAVLQRYRPRRVVVHHRGDRLPRGLLAHLRKTGDPGFVLK